MPTPAAQPPKRSPTSPGSGIQGLWRSQNLAPGATVTIMFTGPRAVDLDGDEPWRARGVPGHEPAQPDLREQFEMYRGHEAKRMGDGFLVLFASARHAWGAAIGAQRKLLTTGDTPTGSIPGADRDPHWRGAVDENDIFGASVNFAARVMSEAQAGEILISALLREVIATSASFRSERSGLCRRRASRGSTNSRRWNGKRRGQPAAKLASPIVRAT